MLNFLPATLRDPASGLVETAIGPITLGRVVPQDNGSALTLALRPVAQRLLAPGEPGSSQAFAGRLITREFLGAVVRFRAEMAKEVTLGMDCFNRSGGSSPDVGQDVRLSIPANEILVLQ